MRRTCLNLLLCLSLATLAPSIASATPSTVQLYDDASLTEANASYRFTTLTLLDQLIWTTLDSEEHLSFEGRKPRLAFPLRAEGETGRHPLAFYLRPGTAGAQSEIVLPIASLRFLDELCTAQAWLQVQNRPLRGLTEYNAILRHGTQPTTGWPTPLQALGVPADAHRNIELKQRALGCFSSARAYLLLHLMGHLREELAGAAAPADESAIALEIKADDFALRVLPRTGVPTDGVMLYLRADIPWQMPDSEYGADHPIDSKRLRKMARSTRSRGLAGQLRALAKSLGNEKMHAQLIATGKAGDLDSLAPPTTVAEKSTPAVSANHSASAAAPKKTAAVDVAPSPTPRHRPFNGHYRTQLRDFSESKSVPVDLWLQREGRKVSGRYSYGLGVGTIRGTVRENWLYFDWQMNSQSGRGALVLKDDGSFSGSWGRGKKRNGGGSWNGRR